MNRNSTLIGLALGTAMIAFSSWQPAALSAEDAEYSPDGAESCLTCHDAKSDDPADAILRTPHALTADLNTPFGMGRNQCETCHGPSDAHLTRNEDGTRPPPAFVFGADTPVSEMNAVCLDCHTGDDRTHWAGSTHDFEQLSCTSCHAVHVEKDPVLVAETQPQVCFDCHTSQRAELLRPSRHPVEVAGFVSRSGALACTDCHNPHGGVGPSNLVRATLNETCYDCHAEKRGPFLWEHAPVREDCTNCHTPHGSQHANLLKTRTPQLCQQCHLAQFHPSTAYSGTGVPPTGAAQQVLSRSCLNCHTQVHGSNHPSGVRKMR